MQGDDHNHARTKCDSNLLAGSEAYCAKPLTIEAQCRDIAVLAPPRGAPFSVDRGDSQGPCSIRGTWEFLCGRPSRCDVVFHALLCPFGRLALPVLKLLKAYTVRLCASINLSK